MSFFWRPYVSVAQRQAKADREMKKLRDKGKVIRPVVIEGRTIASRFWGKKWCDHMEAFSDFANRLPRGSTYVRNGSVCHLDIKEGKIEAYVRGSEMYTVAVTIDKLAPPAWARVKKMCAGEVGSLLELLQGKLSDAVMTVVSDTQKGLFPRPGEMKFKCSCPDWADMCKHVAAVLYGVGHRLDTKPELLFTLRGVDPADLVAAAGKGLGKITAAGAKKDAIADEKVGALFGVELDQESPAGPIKKRSKKMTAAAPAPVKKTAAGKKIRGSGKAAPKTPKPETKSPVLRKHATGASSRPKTIRQPTSREIARLRRQAGLTLTLFAKKLKVSLPTVMRWETVGGTLALREKSLQAINAFRKKIGAK